METKKVIEQKHYPKLEIDFAEHDHIQIWMRGKEEVDLVLIENESRTEVAKAIDPKYQELEDRNAKLLEALNELVELRNRKLKHGKDFIYCERQPKAWEQAEQLIQQSETK